MNARLYRFTPPDRTGWFLGLGAAQVLPLLGGLALAVVLLAATQSLLVALLPAITGTALAFTRLADRPVLEAVPTALRWVADRSGRRFEAPLPLTGPAPTLPASFGSCVVFTVPALGGNLAVAADAGSGVMSASLRVNADSPFLLAGADDQERILAAFGDALAPLCRAADSFTLRWSSFAAPVGMPTAAGLAGPAADSYRELVSLVAAAAHHEVLFTLTLAGRPGHPDPEAVDVLAGELGLLAGRLADAGLAATPVGPEAFGIALRLRFDPAGRGSPEALATLAEAAGFAAMAGAGPMCAEEHWDHLRVDATVHRTYHLVEWPRSGVPAAWTSDLLLSLPVVRTLCVVLEPVSARASRRNVERQAAKLDSDEEQRRRAGFRVGAEHDATREALSAREAELVAGHPEFDYAGLVVLSAPTLEELDAREAQARSTGAAAGVELAPLHGRHGLALALCLPLPRVLARGIR